MAVFGDFFFYSLFATQTYTETAMPDVKLFLFWSSPNITLMHTLLWYKTVHELLSELDTLCAAYHTLHPKANGKHDWGRPWASSHEICKPLAPRCAVKLALSM